MDYLRIFNGPLHDILLWLAVITAIAGVLVKIPWVKGYFGERDVRLRARLSLPRGIYHSIHDVTLPTLDGTTQIDHIFVSRYGIFVVETKNMKGWIFGGEKDRQWTSKIYRRSFRFQNPLRQNFKHVKAVEAILDAPAGVIRSVVVFIGGSTFKTRMPDNVTDGSGFVSYVKSFQEPVLSEAQVTEAAALIESRRLERSIATNVRHVERLKSRSNPNIGRRCPRCGSKMVLRTTKRGAQAGRQFWGCSKYPKCRAVQDAR